MRLATIIVLLTTGSVAAEELTDNDYRAMDDARAKVIAALDAGDAAAFASYVGTSFATRDLWFDNATCRKKFGAATVTARNATAFAKCFAGLKVWAEGLVMFYGPGIFSTVRFDVKAGKATIKSIAGSLSIDKTLPDVWRKKFEANRTEGAFEISLDDTARAELAAIGEKGVAFEACVDKTGGVSKIIVMPTLSASGPTAKQIRASTKSWRFKPFLAHGKPVAVCATELAQASGALKP